MLIILCNIHAGNVLRTSYIQIVLQLLQNIFGTNAKFSGRKYYFIRLLLSNLCLNHSDAIIPTVRRNLFVFRAEGLEACSKKLQSISEQLISVDLISRCIEHRKENSSKWRRSIYHWRKSGARAIFFLLIMLMPF